MTRLPIGPLVALWLNVNLWADAHKVGFVVLVVAWIVACVVVMAALASPADGAEPIPRLLDAIRQVESSNLPNPEPGDDGKSIGPYQISYAYWLDADMPDGCYEDCRDRAYAERVILRYWQRYCPKALRGLVLRTLAVTHNLGPHPERKPRAARQYWRKVQKAMDGGGQ
jgi:hypothetical protein